MSRIHCAYILALVLSLCLLAQPLATRRDLPPVAIAHARSPSSECDAATSDFCSENLVPRAGRFNLGAGSSSNNNPNPASNPAVNDRKHRLEEETSDAEEPEPKKLDNEDPGSAGFKSAKTYLKEGTDWPDLESLDTDSMALVFPTSAYTRQSEDGKIRRLQWDIERGEWLLQQRQGRAPEDTGWKGTIEELGYTRSSEEGPRPGCVTDKIYNPKNELMLVTEMNPAQGLVVVKAMDSAQARAGIEASNNLTHAISWSNIIASNWRINSKGPNQLQNLNAIKLQIDTFKYRSKSPYGITEDLVTPVAMTWSWKALGVRDPTLPDKYLDLHLENPSFHKTQNTKITKPTDLMWRQPHVVRVLDMLENHGAEFGDRVVDKLVLRHDQAAGRYEIFLRIKPGADADSAE